jgi:hypothetical protein
MKNRCVQIPCCSITDTGVIEAMRAVRGRRIVWIGLLRRVARARRWLRIAAIARDAMAEARS